MKLIHPTATVTMPIAMQRADAVEIDERHNPRLSRTGDNPDDASADNAVCRAD